MSDNWYWYHSVLTTYGAWLPGDERGFRTHKHRIHVEGDYKNRPPEGKYNAVNKSAKRLMVQPVVTIPTELREFVCKTVLERLWKLDVFVLCMAVSGKHLHGLCKMPFNQANYCYGLAKKHLWFELRNQHGWKGKLFAKRGKHVVVNDRDHQLNAYHYILRHLDQGAFVWDWVAENEKRKAAGLQPLSHPRITIPHIE